MKRIIILAISFLLITSLTYAIPPTPPSSGVSASTVLPDGVTATTQSAANKSTSVATTAYVDTPTTQTVTTADSGSDSTHATQTITPTANVQRLTILRTCSDDDGCTDSMAETGAVSGARVTIINIGTYHCDYATSAGVLNLTQGTPYAMAAGESLTLEYANNQWNEVGRATATVGPFATWVLPNGTDTASGITAAGSIYFESDTEILTIGDGATSISLDMAPNVIYTFPSATSTLASLAGTETLTNKTLTANAMTPAEVDGHTTSTDLTAAQVSNTVIHNYDQAASDVFLIAPTAAAGYSALFTVTTAQSNHWCFEAAATDKIYLIAAAGTIASGDDGAGVCMIAAQVGQSFACWTFKSGAATYDWMCKAIAIGTSTFEAHASSE